MKAIIYHFHKGSSVNIVKENKRVHYIFQEDMTFHSHKELEDFVLSSSYTCGSCQYHNDKHAGFCNYRGTDVTKEDIRARAEGRVCSKFKIKNP